MTSIFTKIINREIPAEIVWEDENYLAFLDIKPLNPGHLLLVPKKEISYVFDMNDSKYQEIMLIAKFLALPLQKATNAKRIGLSIQGLEVDHVHVHLVPINEPGDMDSSHAKNATPEELKEIAEKIKNTIKLHQ